VDVGAITDGLVHISELSDRRVRRVEDVVQSGDSVDVWIKEVDLNTGRISLSMRRKPDRPMEQLQPGTVLTGKVTSLTKYGVFVDIGAETEGLVHISEMSSGFIGDPKDVVQPGQTIEVRVKEVDKARERISLSMAGLADDHSQPAPAASRPAQAANEPEPQGPAERVPTVVELALRKALGKGEDDEAAAASGEPGAEVAARGEPADLGEVYARMLEEYRAQKPQE
jgi:transcriptional accessory protein Tex/SPT6